MQLPNTLITAVSLSFFLLACGNDQNSKTNTSTSTVQPVEQDSNNTGATQKPIVTKNDAAEKNVHNWRINDTLELECSQPLATFITDEQHTPQTVWGQIALRGRSGWYKLLETNAYWTLYHASVAPSGKLFQLPTVGVESQIGKAHYQSKKPLKVAENDFFYNTYDVSNLTWTEYLDEDLSALPARQIEPDYLGGELDDKTYYPLPYWIAQEKVRLQKTHHLPIPEQLSAYLELSQDTAAHTGRLMPTYRPLLADLLRTYQTYPMSPDTANLINQALHTLQGKGK